MRRSRNLDRGVRVSLLALASGVALWSAWIWRTPAFSQSYDDLVWQVAAGETFSREDLDRLAPPCTNANNATRHPRAALLGALVAVRRAEDAMLVADADEVAARASCAGAAVRALLQSDPASSLGWYLLAWVSRLEGGDPDRASTFLERSVLLAPRELWMAVRRRTIMEAEALRGRAGLVRGDYRTLAEGERPAEAVSLLRACLARDPTCGVDWNIGLSNRTIGLVQREMLDRR